MVGLPKRPYPGLRPFGIDEWEIFFGREVMTEDVVQRLLSNRLVLVHGSSGSGKSSLVYAGVLPQLERRRRRRKLTIKSGMIRPGRSPLRSLAAELAGLCASPGEYPDVDAMHRTLIRGRGARSEIEARIRETGLNELCIFIDQFEELFRFAREGDPEEARIFADVLVGLAEAKEADAVPQPAPVIGKDHVDSQPVGIFTVLTMRSEFLGDCTAFPGLAETVNRTQYLLPNMSRADLLRAIREPATLFRESVDWELAEQLAQDASREADALPLIQHALMRLWEQRSGKSLRLADYVAAAAPPRDGEGPAAGTGMAYILAAHAEEILQSSLVRDRKDDTRVVEYLFRALTDIDNEGRAIRRPQPFDRLSQVTGASEDILMPILDVFRADGVSFVTPYESKEAIAIAPGDMIDISHEALIRCWPRIATRTIDPATGRPRGWLHREFQDGLVWRSLAVQAQAFLANGEACLDPATTEQRWPWFETTRERPAWALRYLIERKGSSVPQEEPEWQAVEQLMTASYERWQAEKNRTRSAELKAEIARTEFIDPESLRGVRQRIMQLFQDGRYGDAVTKLQAQTQAISRDNPEWAELQGLLGRLYKQIFIESRRNPDAALLDSEIALQHAITAYGQAFEAAGTVWPGVNLLACTIQAQESGYANVVHVDPSTLARRLLGEMERIPPSQRDNFYQAAMLEVQLAMGDWDAAETHLHSFIENTSTTAFALRDTIQQITEVWRLDQKGDRGRGFVTAMQAALIAMPGGHLDLSGDVARTLSNPRPSGEQLERILGGVGPKTYDWFMRGLAVAHAVGLIRDAEGNRIGTGFLVGGGDFNLDVDEPVVMTNAHLIGDPPRGSAVSHRDASITFEAVDAQRRYAVAGVVWSSHRHDACLLRLDVPVLDILPLPLAPHLPSISASSHPRVYVIGHRGGRDLAFSMLDNELLDHEGPPSGNPPDPAVVRLHYRAAVEEGSSGSPVFDSTLWQVIALHHAGGSIARLNGQTGSWQANEGIWIQSIVQAVRHDVAGQAESVRIGNAVTNELASGDPLQGGTIWFVDLVAEYKSLWETAVIRPEKVKDVKAVAQKLRSLKPAYDEVSAATTVPWFIVGLIHNLEASFKMTAHLHNGDPLSARTVQVPSGRPKNGSPPFSWAASAIDALTMHGMQNVGKNGWSIERISFELERYNGFGYRRNHPTVKSPYLWSCTNHYTSGKYIDHKFSMTAVSDQVGAMAVLKQLVADGVVTLDEQANLPPPKPPQRPPAVPVPTGLFLADTQPFGLRAEPKDDAHRLLRVRKDMPVRKLEDVDAVWRKVEVMAPDTSTHAGFARQDWLKPQTVLSSFVPEVFAQACLDVAARYGTNAHLLIALANAETALTNKVSPNGLYFGPYAISESEWKATNVPAETGFGDEGRFNPLAQTAIAARFIVKLTQEAREKLPDRRLPSSEELFLARVFGTDVLPALLSDANQTKTVREVLAPMSAADIDALFARRPGLMTDGITVRDLRAAIDAVLSTGFEDAAGLIGKIDPDLSVGPPETTDDVADVPWMVKAKEELAKGIHEFKNGSNPEIEKYFVDTTLGRQPDDVSWSAAFVSWCIKESNGNRSPLVFSARAADWLNNGTGLDGPQYGAVVVTSPLAASSSGHVGFVVAWDGTHVTILGGNQGNAVRTQEFKIDVVRGWRMV